MYACINCRNKSFMEIAAGAAKRFREARKGIGASGAGGPGASTSEAGVAPRSTDGGAEVFALEGVEAPEREDLLEPLADPLEPPAASFLATLWAAAPCRRARR